ncbi:MAG: hypothetical protein HYR66_15940, partial [Sphingobacteriales bacterium]|nr:hypothetical protein [Sphingobacteriales bacterium]
MLKSNQLTGLSNLNCPALTYIDLDSNKLTGSLPNFNLPSLRSLQINANQLTGSIPPLNLPELTGLGLKSNKLTGSIPYLNLPKSISIDFSNNQLSGGIAQVNLNSMVGLNLTNNRLNFDSMEYIYSRYFSVFFYPQANIKINSKNNLLSVNAGGTLSKNTYVWFQKQPDSSSFKGFKQAVGDSTLNNPPPGSYYAMVTNSASPLLILFSDTVSIGLQLKLSNPNSSMINP